MDRDALRKRLLDERERLEREIVDLDADLSESLEDSSEESPYDQHMAETAAVTLDREIDLTLEENARASISQIDRALRKLENGSYGRCDKCGKPIGDDRLQRRPLRDLVHRLQAPRGAEPLAAVSAHEVRISIARYQAPHHPQVVACWSWPWPLP